MLLFSKILANLLTLRFPILDKKYSRKPDLIAKANNKIIVKFKKEKKFSDWHLIISYKKG